MISAYLIQGQKSEKIVVIAITRTDLIAAELRAAASRTRGAPAERRMLALALALEGVDRKAAAQTCGMD